MSGSDAITSLSGKRVVVFGGGGFLGRHLVSHLAHNDARVVSFGRNHSEPQLKMVENVVGSLTDMDQVIPAMDGADVVVCLAPTSLPGTQPALSEIDDNLRPTMVLATTAADLGVKKFLFASSGGTVYGQGSEIPLVESETTRPLNGYGASKLAIESYLNVLARQSEMQTVSLRVANPYGPGQDSSRGQGFIAAVFAHIYQGQALNIWGDGSTVRDYIHVRDVATAFGLACQYGGAEPVLNLGSGQGQTLLEVIAKIEGITGRTASPVFEPSRSIDVSVNVLDISLTKQELGWQPETNFDRGITDMDRWMKHHNAPQFKLAQYVGPKTRSH